MKQYLTSEVEINVEIRIDGGIIQDVWINDNQVKAVVYDLDLNDTSETSFGQDPVEGKDCIIYAV